MSLNDVCCYIPVWFGVIATFFTGLVAYECSLDCNSSTSIGAMLMNIVLKDDGKSNKSSVVKQHSSVAAVLSFVFAMGAMAVMPAHLMRSVGGGYDNESVAMSAMMLTFYLWVRSLRAGDDKSPVFGFLAGVAYFYVSISLFSICRCAHICSQCGPCPFYRWLQCGEDMFLF